MVILGNLQLPQRVMRMQVLWWCLVGRTKKVEYLTLKMTTLAS
jgi:hypothetical protein